MPLGFDICPGNKDHIYVNTSEGSVYEMLLTPNSLQQRSFFPDLHDAPITKIQTLDFKSFFENYIQEKKLEGLKENPKFSNFFLTSSFDWTVKLWKKNMTDCLTFTYHNDFVSSLDINPYSPFCFASADTEGKVAIWKLSKGHSESPFFIWENEHAISSIKWNKKGIKLGISDVNGSINVITFPRSKLIYSDKVLTGFVEQEIKNINQLK